MRISVCTDALFEGVSTAEAMKRLNSIGVKTIEFWSWWDKDIDGICEAKEKYGMNISAMCTKFISLTEPSKRNEYIEGLQETVAAAKRLGVKKIISQTGDDTGENRACQHESLVTGLVQCAPMLEREEITLLVEPLNTQIDHKGYYLYSSKESFDIIDEVGSDNVRILFDIYHQQITEGNLINSITASIDKIGHFHAAGLPGRHELDIGEINYKNIFAAIDKCGYTDYIGFEYFSLNKPEDGILKYIG